MSVIAVAQPLPDARIGPGESWPAGQQNSVVASAGVPICAIDAPGNCQAFTTWDSFLYLSDRCFADNCLSGQQESVRSLRVADDFVADATGDISQICVKGAYARQPISTDGANCGCCAHAGEVHDRGV